MVYNTLISHDWIYDVYNSTEKITEHHIIIAKIFLPSGILFVSIPGSEETRAVLGYDDVKLLIRNCNGIKTLIIQYLKYLEYINNNYKRVEKEYTVTGDFAIVSRIPIKIEDCNKEGDKNG
jgi:hypothetical protein